MRRIALPLLALAFLVSAAAEQATGSGPASEKSAAVRVGTFDQRAVALAYRRSKLFAKWLDGQRQEFKRAKEAGDERRAKAVTDEIVRQQDAAHREVFGTGPYDAIAELLQPIFARTAKAHDVALIAPRLYFSGPSVTVIDLTAPLLDALDTDAATRSMIKNLDEQIHSGKYKPEEFKEHNHGSE